MKKKTYSEKLKSPQWQKKRLEIMKRDKFTCKLCGDTETTLHVHHKEYIDGNNPWEYENSYLVTLCEDCHTEIETIKKDNPEVSFEKIKIFKSDNWTNGSKIIFTKTPHNLAMSIYDDTGNYVCGYNFNRDIPDLIKILKQAQNG
jgi:hypothetical protein